MGFDKCILTCSYHCSILQNSFTVLKILSVPSLHPLFPNPSNHESFYCLHSFAFLGSLIGKIIWYVAFLFGEGNGTALQYSCLENPMDGGAW